MKHIGKGWRFPPKFNIINDKLETEIISDDANIEQSLRTLMATSLGSRFTRPYYGNELNKFVFSMLTETQKTIIIDALTDNILTNEVRIDIEEIDIVENKDLMNECFEIIIDYSIKETNSRRNFVFPFYINEGTNINF